MGKLITKKGKSVTQKISVITRFSIVRENRLFLFTFEIGFKWLYVAYLVSVGIVYNNFIDIFAM